VEKEEKKAKRIGFFHKKDKKEEEKKSVKIYEKGLSKSRQGFVSKLANLTNKYNKVNEEYFEELEEILIMADIGVNTVMEFMDRLRDRVKKESIEDTTQFVEIKSQISYDDINYYYSKYYSKKKYEFCIYLRYMKDINYFIQFKQS